MGEQDNTIMAGEGGLLSKIGRDRKRKQEWWDRTGGSEQKGDDRQESRENTEQLRNRDSNTAQHDKIWKRQERTERNVKKNRIDRTE
jgi:hypothetical protein